MGLDLPTVVAIPVFCGGNSPGESDGADGEIALDIQVTGSPARPIRKNSTKRLTQLSKCIKEEVFAASQHF